MMEREIAENEIVVFKQNHAFLKLRCYQSTAMEISEAFSFSMPGAKFTPLFKMGRWDGMIRIFNLGTRLLPSGLFQHLVDIAKERNFVLTVIKNPDEPSYGLPTDTEDVNETEIKEFVDSLDIHSRNEKLSIYDYQYAAVYAAIHKRQTILKAATSAGKSMIVYAIVRYLTEVLGIRTLIITPTVGLVSQFNSDFKDYSCVNGYDVEKNVLMVSAGVDKTIKKPITISTFQSLKNVPDDFFNQFGAIITDEGHTITAASFKRIYGNATETKFRLACTGTLHELKCNILEMIGLTGPVTNVVSAAELIAAGRAVPLKIKALQLNYPEEYCKALKKADYDTELNWILNNPKRVKFVVKLALSTKGTTLILFNRVDHGKAIYDQLKEFSSKPVHFIYGAISKDDREEIRQMANEEDSIVIASLGTTKAGVNLPAIENIIDTHPMRSKISFLQSIGRGIRLKKGKTHCNLFTIGDNLTYKTKVNTTFKHFGERLRLLSEEEHEFSVVSINF